MVAESARRQAPIGVFDSGIGGLTVVHALQAQLPHESLIYVGDTARVPYGPKSPETVQRYARQIATWLLSQGVKAIVVACNTATAHALTLLQDEMPVPVIGVIQPGAIAAVAAHTERAIGVIGTAGTIGSRAYETAIHDLAPSVAVIARACPLFAPLVEEGLLNHPATRIIANEYLQAFSDTTVDTLVLGCTHYPLLAPVIQETVGPRITLIDSAQETAREVAHVLTAKDLAAVPFPHASMRFVATDAPERFLALAQRFLGDTVANVEHVTFT